MKPPEKKEREKKRNINISEINFSITLFTTSRLPKWNIAPRLYH
jgi:hypothetical protein